MAISGVGGSSYNPAVYAAKNAEPKGQNPALSYNYQKAINEQNTQTGSQFSFEKTRAATGAQLVLNLVV